MTTTNDFLVGLLNNIETMCDEHDVPPLKKLELIGEIAERLAADDECYGPLLDELRDEARSEMAKTSRTRGPRRKKSDGWNRGKMDQFAHRLFSRPNKFEL